jgi:ribosomal-protein-alanine N-acetyltransferase
MNGSSLHFPLQFPALESSRLQLRMVQDADAEIIFRLYANEKVMLQRGEPVFKMISDAEKLIFHWRKLFAEENGLRWGIILKENKKLIGTLGFKKIFHQHLRADLGYELDPEFWNKGIMTEAVGIVCEYGFGKMNLHSIEANITPDHHASKRILEKNGFTLEAHYKENYFYQHWWDSAIYCRRR